MYTQHTFQDWLNTPEHERMTLIRSIITAYKRSKEFRDALEGQVYFRAENSEVARKKMLRPQKFTTTVKEKTLRGDEVERTKSNTKVVEITGNRVYSRFFFRIATQQNQHLLSNGVTIGNVGDISGSEIKKRLGPGFDTFLSKMGENAICQGVSWGYWNLDHWELIEAAKDEMSGLVALLDEESGAPRVCIQFWQIANARPMWVRLFEEDGLTVYRTNKDKELEEVHPKRPYVQNILTDSLGEEIIGGENYASLPIIPMFANPERRNELDNSLKSKIDAYDRISSDFTDNLDRANDVYWVLNNFGGTTTEVAEMLEQIRDLQVVLNRGDATGGSTSAEPHTIEVPYLARKTALQLLEASIYKDAMALSLEEITGVSLTNVAIRAATTNLNLKCDRFEWQVFAFVQQALRLIGIETENISFVRQALVNQTETIADIDTMLPYIDMQTALELNPLIPPDAVQQILERKRQEMYAGMPVEPYEDEGSVVEVDKVDNEVAEDDSSTDALGAAEAVS